MIRTRAVLLSLLALGMFASCKHAGGSSRGWGSTSSSRSSGGGTGGGGGSSAVSHPSYAPIFHSTPTTPNHTQAFGSGPSTAHFVPKSSSSPASAGLPSLASKTPPSSIHSGSGRPPSYAGAEAYAHHHQREDHDDDLARFLFDFDFIAFDPPMIETEVVEAAPPNDEPRATASNVRAELELAGVTFNEWSDAQNGDTGVAIAGIVPNGAGDQIGLSAGDVILRAGPELRPVASVADLERIAVRAGGQFPILFTRAGAQRTVTIAVP